MIFKNTEPKSLYNLESEYEKNRSVIKELKNIGLSNDAIILKEINLINKFPIIIKDYKR